MTVWWSRTWLTTEPSEYLASSWVAASSTASEIAIPRLPGESGSSAQDPAPGVGEVARRRVHRREPGFPSFAQAIGLLLIRDLDHVDGDLEVEQGPGERQRGPPLPGALSRS